MRSVDGARQEQPPGAPRGPPSRCARQAWPGAPAVARSEITEAAVVGRSSWLRQARLTPRPACSKRRGRRAGSWFAEWRCRRCSSIVAQESHEERSCRLPLKRDRALLSRHGRLHRARKRSRPLRVTIAGGPAPALRPRCRQRLARGAGQPRRVDKRPGGSPAGEPGSRLRCALRFVRSPPNCLFGNAVAFHGRRREGLVLDEFPLLTRSRGRAADRQAGPVTARLSRSGAGTSLPHTHEHLPKHIRLRHSSRRRPGHRFFVVPRKIDTRNAPASRRPAADADCVPPA